MSPEQLYNQLRNTLATYDTTSLIEAVLEILLTLDLNPKQFAYWNAFTLIRWAILHSSSSNLILLKKASHDDVVRLLQAITMLEEEYLKRELDKGKEHMYIQLSVIANQQFPFQLEPDQYTFARQIILYTKIVIKQSKLKDQFAVITGLSLMETINVFVLFYWCLYPDSFGLSKVEYNGKLSQIFTSVLNSVYGKDKSSKFVKMLTIPLNPISTARTIITKSHNLKYPIFDIFFHSPLTLHPMLLIKGTHRIIHRNVFNVTFRYFIYDTLKQRFKEDFTAEFGKRVEEYVRMGLNEINANYLDENTLRKLDPTHSKTVDFIVDESTIIECKGIELHPYPRVNPSPENLSNYLKGSIVKAIKDQVVGTIANRGMQRHDIIVVIITYKEFNIGFGTDLLAAIIFNEAELKEISKVIDPTKIFIMDLEEWEKLLRYVKAKKLTISKMLDFVVSENKKVPKKLVSMHLSDLYGKVPDNVDLHYLRIAYDEMMDNLKDSFSQYES